MSDQGQRVDTASGADRPGSHHRGVFGWRARTRRAVTTRRIFPVLIVITAALGLLAGFIMTLTDRTDFPNWGVGAWWAIVTIGTVGYGDVVPHSTWGRVVASIIILIGVTFISFLTATVTSYFVSAEQERAKEGEREEREAERERFERSQQRSEQSQRRIEDAQNRIEDAQKRIEGRITAIESKLGG